jgi:hypothetical protein
MKIYQNYKDYPKQSWRWPSFSPQEMASRGDGRLAVDEDAMDKLQALRDRLGRPLIVNSAYRSPSHNKKVGGATNSLHLQARAFDISMSNHDPAIFEAAARAVGFTGFGFYKNSGFIHVDTGPAREWNKRWFKPTTISTYAPEVHGQLNVEQPRHAETVQEDRAAIGSLVGGGGAIAGGGAVISSIGSLSPTAQVIAVIGIVLAIAAAAYVFRARIRKLAK